MPKIGIKIGPLPDGTHKQAGQYDNARRWYPRDEFYKIPGAFCVRSPSRAWPYNYLKHFYTSKYSKLLFENNPRLWLNLNGIDINSKEAAPYIAAHTERRIIS